jgi:hypothetical protein
MGVWAYGRMGVWAYGLSTCGDSVISECWDSECSGLRAHQFTRIARSLAAAGSGSLLTMRVRFLGARVRHQGNERKLFSRKIPAVDGPCELLFPA